MRTESHKDYLPLTFRATMLALLCCLFPTVESTDLAVTIFEMRCREKTNGVSGGKICTISERQFLLKAVDQPPENPFQPNMDDAFQNLRLFQKLGTRTPNTVFIEEKRGVYTHNGKHYYSDRYLASELINSFVDANTLKKQAVREFYKTIRNKLCKKFFEKETFTRNYLVKQIGGESGLAQLAVSSSFCDDIAPNGANWGSSNQKLIIIDADLSPKNIEGYLQLASKMPTEIGISFTMMTIQEMVKIYEKMLKSPEKYSSHFPHLIENEYLLLISTMCSACRNVIKTFSNDQGQTPLCPKKINELLTEEIEIQRLLFLNSEGSALLPKN